MNLEKFQLLHEDEESFHVKHEDGTAFRVAKAKLSRGMIDKISQHFAEGGEVQDPLSFLGSDAPTPGPYADPAPAAAPAAAGPDPTTLAGLQALRAQNPQEDAGTIAARYKAGERGTQDRLSLMKNPAPNFQVSASDDQLAQAATAMAPKAEAPEAATGAEAPAAQPATPPVPPKPIEIPGGIPGADQEMSSALRAQQEAARKQADIAARESDVKAKIASDLEAKKALVVQNWNERLNTVQARADQVREDIASSKIDPKHLWSSASTGQKISASIGMILGGIGAALAGGPNYAVQIIDNAIQRDVEAQKANLGKKESQLRFYMDQGHDMQTAKHLAVADLNDAAAGQIQAASLKFGNEKAKAAADQEVATLRAHAVQLRQQAAATNIQMQLHGLQLIGAKQALEAQAALTAATQGGGGITPEVLAKYPPDSPVRKSAVLIPEERTVTKNGQPVMNTETGAALTRKQQVVYQAIDEDAAKAARKELPANTEMIDKVSRLQKFVQDHPRGAWGPTQTQKAAALANDIKLSWLKTQEGVGRLNPAEEKMLDEMIAKPDSWWGAASGKNVESAKNLMDMALSKREAIKSTYLLPVDSPYTAPARGGKR